MDAVRGVDALLACWEEAANDETTSEEVSKKTFYAWRGDHLARHRMFAGLKQREAGDTLGVSQSMYAKFEQAAPWTAKYGPQIVELLNVPTRMLKTHNTAREFFGRDGGMTFVRLIEAVMERWGDESERTEEHLDRLPVQFIQDRLDSERRAHHGDERPDKVSAFLSKPDANDLDADAKRWLEQLFDLGKGVLVDAAHYDEKRVERRAIMARNRRNFIANVTRILEERRWTPADLAIKSGIPLLSIASVDGSLQFQPLSNSHIAGVAMALNIEPALLLMENGTDMQRESAAAFQDLPAMPRSFMAWLYAVLPKVGAPAFTPGSAAVAAMLPMFRAMLDQAYKDANRSPDVAEAMNGLFSAYLPKDDAATGGATA